MGRKSLLKSTTKKKPKAKKKAAPKASVKASEPKKKVLKSQTKATKKATPARKAAAPAKAKAAPKAPAKTKTKATAVKAKPKVKTTTKPKEKIVAKATAKPKAKPKKTVKATKAAPAKKAAAVKKAKVSIKDLLFKKFATAKAKAAKAPKKAAIKIPEAPPIVSGYSKEETKRIRALLFKTFEATAGPSVKTKKKAAPTKSSAKAKKAAPVKKAKVSKKDLLFRKFATVKAKVAKAPKKAAIKIPEAPPIVSGYSKEETKRIRALLFKTFEATAGPGAEVKKTEAFPKDLLFRKFETTPTKAVSPPSGPQVPEEIPPAAVLSRAGDGMGNAMKAGLAALAVLIVIIFSASLSNRDNFYLKNTPSALEVWRGKFAPTGTELVLSLDGIKAPNPIRQVYTKQEVYPLLFNSLQKKADGAINDPKGPDLAKIKRYLRQASAYAPTEGARKSVQLRLRSVDFVVLFHKADFALSKGTMADLKAAKRYLNRAKAYAFRDYHRELLAKTRKAVDKEMAALRKK